MKSYRNLLAVALGLFFAVSLLGGSSAVAAMKCPMCKAEMPADSKPVVAMLAADAKCSMCGMEMKAGTEASKLTCPACKAEIVMCGKCAKGDTAEAAAM